MLRAYAKRRSKKETHPTTWKWMPACRHKHNIRVEQGKRKLIADLCAATSFWLIRGRNQFRLHKSSKKVTASTCVGAMSIYLRRCSEQTANFCWNNYYSMAASKRMKSHFWLLLFICFQHVKEVFCLFVCLSWISDNQSRYILSPRAILM